MNKLECNSLKLCSVRDRTFYFFDGLVEKSMVSSQSQYRSVTQWRRMWRISFFALTFALLLYSTLLYSVLYASSPLASSPEGELYTDISLTAVNSVELIANAALEVAPVISVWYGNTQDFGQQGTAQQWINLLGNVSPTDDLVLIPDVESRPRLDYELNGVKSTDNVNLPLLILGPGERRVAHDGDFNLEFNVDDLNDGVNTIIISATHSSGTVTKTVTLDYDKGTTWPLPYVSNWGGITNQDIANVHEMTQIVDGKWRLENDGLRTDVTGYDRIVAFGDRTWSEYEATVEITINGIDEDIFGSETSGTPGLGLVTRWEGHTKNPPASEAGCLIEHCGWLPQGANPFYEFNDETTGTLYMAGEFDPDEAAEGRIVDPLGRDLNFGTPYLWKVRVENISATQTRYSFKLWEAGQDEPLRYQMIGVEDIGPATGQTSGSLLVVAHHVDATIGDVVISTPVPINTQQLTTTVVGGGTILVDPIYDEYIQSEPITVTAVPSVGWSFDGWSGDLGTSIAQQTLVMANDRSITATFAPITTASVHLSYTGTGSGLTRVEPDQPLYNLGDVVKVTALPEAGSQFDGWDGVLTPAELTNPVTYTIQLSNTIVAEFGPNQSGIVSDDFNACALDTALWTYSTGYATDPTAPEFTGTDVGLIAPAGTYHVNVPGEVRTIRLTQPINDVDFHIETKMVTVGELSPASEGSQAAGLLVYQNDDNLYHFEVKLDDGLLKLEGYGLSGGAYYGGSFNVEPEVTNIRYLNLRRELDSYYLSYSEDGTTWFQAPPVFIVLNVTQLGIYAANDSIFDDNNMPIDGTEPKHTAVFDYFYNLDALGPGDAPTQQNTLTLLRSGNGTVDIGPELPAYGCGQTLTLTPSAAEGSQFAGWGEDLSGDAIPETIVMDADRTVSAAFSTIPTYTLDVTVDGDGFVTVFPQQDSYLDGTQVTLTAIPTAGLTFFGWSGDVASASTVESLIMDEDKSVTAKFGVAVTATLDLSVVGDGYIAVDPAQSIYNVGDIVTLTAIPNEGAAFTSWDGDLLGTENNPVRMLIDDDKTIIANFGLNLSGIRSDDFDGCQLNSFWAYSGGYISDPQSPLFSGTQMALMVPDDDEHYVSAEGNTTIRLSQAAQDADFEVEVKFASEMSKRYQVRGIFVEDSAGNLLEIQFYHDGDRYNLYIPPVNQGEPIFFGPQAVGLVPTYVRMERVGDDWTIYYSADANTWLSVPFSKEMSVARIGVYGGATADSEDPFPAHPVLVDYFYNVDALTEGDQPIEQYPLTAETVGAGEVAVSPPFGLFGCDTPVTLTAMPDIGHYLTEWNGDASGNSESISLIMNGPRTVSAEFTGIPTVQLAVSTDGPGTVVVSPTLASYVVGTVITLTAVPDEGQTFLGWHGDLSGRDMVKTVTMDADKEVTATFGIPEFVNLALNVDGNGTIQVMPEQTTYIVGDEITLTAIPNDGSAFEQWLGDLPDLDEDEPLNPLTFVVNNDTQLTAQFGVNTSGLLSDDFNTCQLEPFWTYSSAYSVDPATPYLSGTEVALYAGGENEYYYDTDGDFLLSLSQEVNDVDFGIELKFDSIMDQAFQKRGLYLEDLFGDRLLIEFFHDGDDYFLFTRGRPELLSVIALGREPVYLRLSRDADDWTIAYSEDGERWKSHNFTQPWRLAQVGVFAGSEADGDVIPEHQLTLDYFYNRNALTAGDLPISQYPLTVNTTGQGSVKVVPSFDLYGCNQSVNLIAEPSYAQMLDDWGGDHFGSSMKSQITVNSAKNVTANFVAAPTFPLTVNTIGQGTTVISPTQPSFLAGEPITVTAIPAEGYNFAGWTGSGLSANDATSLLGNPVIVRVFQDAQLTATFINPNAVPAGSESPSLYLPLISSAQRLNRASAANYLLTSEGRIQSSAINDFHTTAAPDEPAIDVWYGLLQNIGQHGVGQRWINVPGNVADDDSITSLTYSLNGAANQPLNMGPGTRRLADAGDFNLEIAQTDLNEGANTVLIEATNEFNQTSTQSVTLTYDSGSGQDLPYAIDWATISNVNDVAHVIDGNWSATAAGLRTTQIAYDRVVAIGDMAWTEYEVEVPITIHGIDQSAFDKPKSVAPSLGLIMRWQGHTDDPPDSTVECLMDNCGWLPQGANPNYTFARENGVISAQLKLDGGNDLHVTDPLNRELAFGTTYIWKARVENVSGGRVRHSFKLWQEGELEPALYQMVGEEIPTIDAGSLLLLAHHVDATFGDVTVTTPQEIETATLNIPTEGNGFVTVSPAQSTYAVGQEVTLMADPSVGWQFVEWRGDFTEIQNPITFTIDEDTEITAVFGQITTAEVTTSVTGSGSIKIEPARTLYNIGQFITVTAVSDSGAELVAWGGDFAGMDENPIVFEVGQDLHLEAAFGTNVSGILSDDFDECALADFWSYQRGLPDVVAAPFLSGRSVGLMVPSGVEHYVEDVARLMQPANNVDFEVEVKFSSLMDVGYQVRGFMVEDNFGSMIRFEFFHDGANYNLFVGDENNNPIRGSEPIGIVPTYVRLERSNSVWNLYFSATGRDGSWVTRSLQNADNFEVSQIGPYVGNTANGETLPAHFVEIDYFHNRRALPAGDQNSSLYPIDVETNGRGRVEISPAFERFGCNQMVTLTALSEPGQGFLEWSGDLTGSDAIASLVVDGPKAVSASFGALDNVTLTTNRVGEGTVIVTPTLTNYVVGQTIALGAFPKNGWHFDGWSGALSGTGNPTSLLMDGNKSITANFSEITIAQITSIITGSGSIQVEPVQDDYLIGQQITVTAVSEGDSQFSSWGGDLTGESRNPVVMTVDGNFDFAATFGTNESGIRSDDFNQCGLADFWTYKQGLASAPREPSISGTNLALSVPAGAEHYAEEAVRLVQPAKNVDFDIEVKFDSRMTARYQAQGIILEDSAGRTFRFEFFYDGTNHNLFVAPDTSTTGILFLEDIIKPSYVRLQRSGANWTISYSENGTEDSWQTQNVPYNFEVSEIGIFAGNTADVAEIYPSHTAIVDYFYNRNALSGGDLQPIEQYSLDISASSGGSVTVLPELDAYGCGQPVYLTALPVGNAAFSDWTGNSGPLGSTSSSSITIQMDENRTIMAQFGMGKVYLPYRAQ